MYHYHISITIFSADESLEKVVQAVEPLAGFTHHVERQCHYSAEKLAQSDLVIWDIPEPLPAHAQGEKPLLAVCAEAQQVFDAQAYQQMDALWVKPFSEERIVFYFSDLQRRLQSLAEAQLYAMYLDTVIDSIPDLVWFKDIQGAHLKVNNSFCQAVQKSKAEVYGRGHYYIWDMSEEEYAKGEYVCLESEESVMAAGRTILFDEKVKTKWGMRQFKTYKSPLFDKDGRIIGTCGVAHDVTDLQNMDTELELFLRSLPFAVLMVGNEGQIIDVNDWCQAYFGEERDAIVGQPYEAWKARNLRQIQEIEGKADYFEAVCCNTEGQERQLGVREEPCLDIFEDKTGLLCLYQDITLERNHEQQIMAVARTDDLTGIFNRRGFYQEMAKRWQGQQAIVLYIDLDNFKQVNDTYGHSVGDRALQLTAETIVQSFPEAVIARMGGDEFVVVLLDDCALDSAVQSAQVFIQALDERFGQVRAFWQMTVSVGLAQALAGQPISLDELIRRGDQALYAAKQQGKARYVVYDDLT